MPEHRLQRTREAYHGAIDIGCLCGACCGERARRKYRAVLASKLHQQYLEAHIADRPSGIDWYMDPEVKRAEVPRDET